MSIRCHAMRPGRCSPSGPRARACASTRWQSRPRSAAMRGSSAPARTSGASSALLHDFDYERYPTPDDHPFRGCDELRRRGYPEWVMRAILSHAQYSGVPRESPLEKSLFACDEMAGFVTAASLVRPSKSVLDLEASSVIKRMKDKAFAQGCVPRRPAAGRRGTGAAARRARHERDRISARTGGRARPPGFPVSRRSSQASERSERSNDPNDPNV